MVSRKFKIFGRLTNYSDDCNDVFFSRVRPFIAPLLVCGFLFSSSSLASSPVTTGATINIKAPLKYKDTHSLDSEFDNKSDPFAVYWQDANEPYQDTVFGELVYSEPSTPTKLEMLRLISKETPSLVVFMHALSMGLSVDEMLLASLEYEPEKARELAGSAVALLPQLDNQNVYRYPTYSLDALKRYVDGTLENRNKGYVNKGEEHLPYSVQEVVNKFFEERLVLAPYPDWLDGQFHFMASAKELLSFQSASNNLSWYGSKTTKSIDDRPIFVSLYEHDKSVLIDSLDRIKAAYKQNPNVQLPVVFVYNRPNERSVNNLGYPATLKGLRDAYVERNLMVTPTPEWYLGEYHSYTSMDEFDYFFDIPEEDDFESGVWVSLLDEAKKYDVNGTSILVVILDSGSSKQKKDNHVSSSIERRYVDGSVLAEWDNPRTESKFQYTVPKGSSSLSLDSLLNQGMVVNRPDLIAALKALGVRQVPVSVYYLDENRVKPYTRGPRSLIQAALGADKPVIIPPGGGALLPASPPGLP